MEPQELNNLMARYPDHPFLPACFDLEKDILEQLSARAGGQRCVVGRHELLLIVHDVPEAQCCDRRAVLFWCRKDGVWIDQEGKQGLKKLGELLEHYSAVIDQNQELVEEADTAEEVFQLARIAGPLARASRNLMHAIDQALVHDEDSKELIMFRDRVKDVERAAEFLNHDTRLTLEYWQAERMEKQQAAAERLNVIAFRLNLLAGFFLPLVALGGLFGMNVDLPKSTRPMFWLIFGLGLSMGAIILWLVGRKPKPPQF
jgi:Mg2+ and Co2+ transporter CorA